MADLSLIPDAAWLKAQQQAGRSNPSPSPRTGRANLFRPPRSRSVCRSVVHESVGAATSMEPPLR